MSNTYIAVDDDPIFLQLIKILFSKLSTKEGILTFSEGEKFLTYLEENIASLGKLSLFLDLNMPAVDGWEVMEYIDKAGIADQIDVIIVTSSVDSKEREKSLTYDFVSDFISKPLSLEKLEKLVVGR